MWSMDTAFITKTLMEVFKTQAEIARVAKVKQPFVSQVLHGPKRFGPVSCVALEKHSNGLVTRQMLRPDDWRDIWPELACSVEASHPSTVTGQRGVSQ